MEIEFQRNGERYAFLKWGKQAFSGIRIVPPGQRHRAPGEPRVPGARRVGERRHLLSRHARRHRFAHDDGERHRRRGLGRGRHRSRSRHARAADLFPHARRRRRAHEREAARRRDRDRPRAHRDRAPAQEQGRRASSSSTSAKARRRSPRTDRAVVANMSPDYGATIGFFGVDEKTIEYFRTTGRDERWSKRSKAYFKAQGLFGIPRKGEIDYSQRDRARSLDGGAERLGAEAPAGPHRSAEDQKPFRDAVLEIGCRRRVRKSRGRAR